MTREQAINYLYCSGFSEEQVSEVVRALTYEPTPKNDLAVDCIDRVELLKAMGTWDKFGNDPNEGLIPLRTPALQDRYVPYVHYYDMVNCVKGMPSVTPMRKKGYWIDTNYHHYYNDGDIETTELKCSCCNEQVEWDIELLHKPYYCENCGADMVG